MMLRTAGSPKKAPIGDASRTDTAKKANPSATARPPMSARFCSSRFRTRMIADVSPNSLTSCTTPMYTVAIPISP